MCIRDSATAIAGLEKVTLDTSALEYEIDLAEEMLADIDSYIPSTVEGLKEKLDDAKNALKTATDQAQIDEATRILREARLSARTKADKSALEAAIDAANSFDLSLYTADSAKDVKAALKKAEAMMKRCIRDRCEMMPDTYARLRKVMEDYGLCA